MRQKDAQVVVVVVVLSGEETFEGEEVASCVSKSYEILRAKGKG